MLSLFIFPLVNLLISRYKMARTYLWRLRLQQLAAQRQRRQRRLAHIPLPIQRRQRTRKKVTDFFSLSEVEFKKHLRFTKENVQRLALLLEPNLRRITNRGLPLSVLDQVCIALFQLAGAAFQRITGLAFRVSQYCARVVTKRVVRALFEIREDWILLPTLEKMKETASKMEQRFHLKSFFAGIDGCQIPFQNCPRNLPRNCQKQDFWCRKHFYSVNVQIISNEQFIYDVDCGWPGKVNDAKMWRRSLVKPKIEDSAVTGKFLLAGDSAYPLSRKLIRPFSQNSANQDQHRFNGALSGLRTCMTENVYARLKGRFPILRQLRYGLKLSKRVIIACCVLHNIAETISDSPPPPNADIEESLLDFESDHTGSDHETTESNSDSDSDSETDFDIQHRLIRGEQARNKLLQQFLTN